MAHPGGRPTEYNNKCCEHVYKLCLLGATDKQIADFFDVCVDTVHEWKKAHQEFSDAIKKGKDNADAVIAQSLYHRAKGYKHEEDQIFNDKGTALIVPTIKHYPPDTAACIFWLKNRQKDKWRDKTDHGVENPDGTPLSVIFNIPRPEKPTE